MCSPLLTFVSTKQPPSQNNCPSLLYIKCSDLAQDSIKPTIKKKNFSVQTNTYPKHKYAFTFKITICLCFIFCQENETNTYF